MTLQELLKTLGLNAEQIASINDSVDVVIASKLDKSQKEHSTITNNLNKRIEEMQTSLSKYQTKEIDGLKTQVAKEIFGDKDFKKGLKYTHFEEDFDFTDKKALKKAFKEVKDDLFNDVNLSDDEGDDGNEEAVEDETETSKTETVVDDPYHDNKTKHGEKQIESKEELPQEVQDVFDPLG